ncbi:MAG: hypothetical protein RL351_232, partial [Actinomycetota bacterium]
MSHDHTQAPEGYSQGMLFTDGLPSNDPKV